MSFMKSLRYWGRFVYKGTVGTVKRCKNKQTNEIVAVKIIKTRDDEIILNAKNEFKRLQKLSHENIISVHELLIDNLLGNVYLVMEFFDGGEMFQLLSEINNFNGWLNRTNSQEAVQTVTRGNRLSPQKRHCPQRPQT